MQFTPGRQQFSLSSHIVLLLGLIWLLKLVQVTKTPRLCVYFRATLCEEVLKAYFAHFLLVCIALAFPPLTPACVIHQAQHMHGLGLMKLWGPIKKPLKILNGVVKSENSTSPKLNAFKTLLLLYYVYTSIYSLHCVGECKAREYLYNPMFFRLLLLLQR